MALTRARRGVVVVGSARTLQEDTNWGTWLRWCQKQGAVTTLEAMTPAPSSGTSREASGGKAERRGGGGKSGEASGLQRVPGGDSGVGGAKVAAHGADAGRGRGRRSMTAAMGATGRGSAVRGELRKRVGAAPGLATGKQGAAGGASSSGRQRDLGKGASSRRRRRTGAE